MIKSLIITHGNLGREMVQVAEKILEIKLDIENISFDWKGDGTEMVNQIERFVRKNREHDIIIFTDMFGGSPANVSTRFIGPKIEVVSGINLPGLLKFISYRSQKIKLKDLVKIIERGAIEGITIISEYLGEKK
jgi:PTS system mannose-specific IIA component